MDLTCSQAAFSSNDSRRGSSGSPTELVTMSNDNEFVVRKVRTKTTLTTHGVASTPMMRLIVFIWPSLAYTKL